MPQIRSHERLYKIPEKNWNKYPKQSRKALTYHNRSGYPDIHIDEKGFAYIMVRAPDGNGTIRLYLDSNGNVPKEYRTKKE